jgi:tellurite resistance protein TerC
VFAILGLRSLFFALSGLMPLVRFLHHGLAAVLVFVGVKMLVGPWVGISIGYSLAIIFGILAATVMASLWLPKKPD